MAKISATPTDLFDRLRQCGERRYDAVLYTTDYGLMRACLHMCIMYFQLHWDSVHRRRPDVYDISSKTAQTGFMNGANMRRYGPINTLINRRAPLSGRRKMTQASTDTEVTMPHAVPREVERRAKLQVNNL